MRAPRDEAEKFRNEEFKRTTKEAFDARMKAQYERMLAERAAKRPVRSNGRVIAPVKT